MLTNITVEQDDGRNVTNLLKYPTLERVTFQLYTLSPKSCPCATCRVPTLHPAGAKLPRRGYVASSVDLDALEHIANFESDPACLKVAIFERLAPFYIFSHHLPAPYLSTMAMSSGFTIYNSNHPEQAEEAFGRLGLFLNRPEPCIIHIAC
jgi:hypothetical protein